MKYIIIFILAVSHIFAQTDEQKIYQHIQNQYELYAPEERGFLLQETDLFMDTYPRSDLGGDILFIAADININEGDTVKAILNLSKICFLYSNGQPEQKIKNSLNTYLRQHFNDFRRPYIEGIKHISSRENKAHAFFEYLGYIYQFDNADMNKELLPDINYFLSHFGSQYSGTDQILKMKAEILFEFQQYRESLFAYSKLTTLFPKSPLSAESLYWSGLIMKDHLNWHEKAQNIFIRIITEFSESSYAADAQFQLAELYRTSLNNPDEALANYQLLIKAYPDNPKVREALYYSAQILTAEQKYEEAIASCYTLLELPQDSLYCNAALWHMAGLYYQNLENYEKAVETYNRIIEMFPDDKKTTEALYNSAMIYEKQLGDKYKALKLYQRIINENEDAAVTKKARQRLKNLK